jgi:O-antigen ligase
MQTQGVRLQQAIACLAGAVLVLTWLALPISTSVMDIGFLLSGALVLLSGLWLTEYRHYRQPAVYAFAALFFFLCIGAIYSVAPEADIDEYLLKMSRFLWGLLLVPLFCRQRIAKWSLYAFVAAMLLTLFLSYLRFFIWPFPANPAWGLACVFKGHIDQGFLLTLSGVIFFQHALLARGRWRYAWALLFFLVLVDVLFMSEGRTGYVIFLLVMIYLSVSAFRWRGLLVSLFAVLVLGAASYQFSAAFHDRLSQTVAHVQDESKQSSLGLRRYMQQGAWRFFKERPWLGHGSASMPSLYARDRGPGDPELADANNIYLNVLVQHGVFGGLLFVLFWAWLFYGSRKLPEVERRLWRSLALMILVGGLVNSWLKDSLEGHAFVLLTLWCFAAPYRQNSPLLARVLGQR